MMKKFTQQEIEEKFNTRGYKLLGTYKDALTPVLIRCPNGHETLMRYNSFKKSNCCFCAGNVKFSFDEAQDQAKKLGYLIIGDYKTANSPVLMRCINGHETKLKLSKIKLGNGCKECFFNKRRSKKEDIISALSKENYTLLGEYKNYNDPIHLKCPSGHEIFMSYGNFNYGFRCRICANKGFDPSKPSILYLMQNNFMQKIGITNTSVKQSRIKKHKRKFGLELLETIYFEKGYDAYIQEQSILQKLKTRKIPHGSDAFKEKFDGYTESWLLIDLEVTNIQELINL